MGIASVSAEFVPSLIDAGNGFPYLSQTKTRQFSVKTK
jgi:hypothetical protein